MREDRVDPEGCLRSLTAEALLGAHPDRPLFPVSLGVMAVANAFVMLGLLPEPLAEAILAEHRSALERQAVSPQIRRSGQHPPSSAAVRALGRSSSIIQVVVVVICCHGSSH